MDAARNARRRKLPSKCAAHHSAASHPFAARADGRFKVTPMFGLNPI
jgi:hypothetical protein